MQGKLLSLIANWISFLKDCLGQTLTYSPGASETKEKSFKDLTPGVKLNSMAFVARPKMMTR